VRVQAERTGHSLALALAATYPLARGEDALFRGQRERADAELASAARLGRKTASVHNYIGTLYGKTGDYPRAIAAFERALEIKPFYLRAWNNLALAHEHAGDLERARWALSRSLELAPGQDEVRAALQRLGPPRS
jgi:Flp pilus assembly protein TadD